MNFLDVLILVLVGVGVLAGLLIGVVRVLCTIGALIAAIFLSLHLNGPASGYLTSLISSEALRRSVAFAAIFLLVLIGGSLAAWGARKFLKIVRLGWIDRTAGAGIGLGGALLVSSLVVMVFASLLPADSAVLSESQIAPLSLRGTEILVSFVPEDLQERLKRQRNALNKRLEQRAPRLMETVKPGTGSQPATPAGSAVTTPGKEDGSRK